MSVYHWLAALISLIECVEYSDSPAHSLYIGIHISIGSIGLGVTKNPSNFWKRDAFGIQPGRIRVPQVMKPEIRSTGISAGRIKRLLNIVFDPKHQ